jgi:hypothetical protein
MRWYRITRCSAKNRERLLNEEIAEGFFQQVLARAKPHMSDEHFAVDGTLIGALGESEESSAQGRQEQPAERGRRGPFSRREAEEPDA